MRSTVNKLLAAVTAVSLFAAPLSGCANESPIPEAETIESIKFLTFSYGETPDYEQVMARLNEISRKKIGVEASIEFLNLATYEEQLSLKLAGGSADEMDVYVALQDFSGMASKGQALGIDTLLDEYGTDIKASLGNLLHFAPVNGTNYFIPFNSSKVFYCTYIFRKDLCEKYNIDPTQVKNYKDLEAVFKVIQENEPEMVCIAPDYGSVLGNVDLDSTAMPAFDPLGDNIGILTGADGTTVVDLFQTGAYADLVATMREWYLKGYISKDAAATSEIGSQLYREGKVFSYMCSMVLETGDGPYEQKGLSTITYPTYALALDKPAINSSIGFYALGINPNSKHAEAAMKWINLLYEDENYINTLYYGVENTHWAKNENGTIRYAEGIEAGNTGWDTAFSWLVGDSTLGFVFDSASDNPDYNKQIAQQNETAPLSVAFGFVFDPDPVITQYTNVSNVMQQYQKALECGAVDPEVELPKFVQALKDAGMDAVVAEKQKQLDEWLQANQ